MTYRKYAYITVFLCVCSLGFAQDGIAKDIKQHPELSKVVRNWAQKLGGELWHFGDLVTRRNKVKDSFKDTSIVVENGMFLLNDILDRISKMMNLKVDAVRRIMDIAEQAAEDQKDSDINVNFQFYNAKTLINSAPNISEDGDDNNGHDNQMNDYASVQELRSSKYFYKSVLPPEEEEDDLGTYQRDLEKSNEEEPMPNIEFTDEIDVTEEEITGEKDPQASQSQPIDKSRLPLFNNQHFYNIPVNTNYSAVHVPSNVYDRSKEVISGIMWSEELDKTFRNNYKIDPTLSWQYFGSSTGFMRQFPAMIWKQEPIDLFDCRTRSWFIEAASSPKDIVILVDRSGSMTGMRREIARHVVHNILDTLGNNDYVNIYTYSNTTEPLVECLDNKLVQANMANIRVFKESMGNFKTEQIANLTTAFITAFELLQRYRELKLGANCNQAIMLITDGSQNNCKEVFDKYNRDEAPLITVRVFTYLVGREISDTSEVKKMACDNKGYYVHLSTYAEVREEVLHYIPVMARPMVLNSTVKPNPAWSPVYADVTDPKLTNWLWVQRAREKQRERYAIYSKYKMLKPSEIDKKFVQQQKLKQDNYGEVQTYRLMTSVSLPVYDKKRLQEKVANLLGVAGTDVPIEYIQKLLLPYRLGVNGYGFIVTNNGYILTHPDLRPVEEGILKPAYNRVDVMEIEIADDDTEPREFSDEMKQFRKDIVMQKRGNLTFKMKSHLDDRKRIMINQRHFFYVGINGTPFTLVITLPNKYGFNRVQHAVENDIHRIRANDKGQHKFTQFFIGNWTIHPDWHYCRYFDDKSYFETVEEELMHFLNKMEGPGWKWGRECDRKLISKVVADAKMTTWFNENITTVTTNEENGPMSKLMAYIYRAQLIKEYAIVVAFMATHSGLTRWQNFPQNIDTSIHETHFQQIHNKAIDETWYKRAIEQHYIDTSSFVYSVPHEIGDANNTLVTVSHAIFKEDGNRKAPVAVVGYQFYHMALYNLFRKHTNDCGNMQKACKKTCESEELHCLMLDDSGYVVVSDNLKETGSFFGDIRPDVMKKLIEENIYSVHRMYDYQGLCSSNQDTGSTGSKIIVPYLYLMAFFEWLSSTLLLLVEAAASNLYDQALYLQQYSEQMEIESAAAAAAAAEQQEHEIIVSSDDEQSDEHDDQEFHDMSFDQSATLNKTKPEPCDYEFYLYDLVYYSERNMSSSAYNKTMDNCIRPFIVQPVTGSNMILIVINNLCREDEKVKVLQTPKPKQIIYPNNTSLACLMSEIELPRRLYMSCINRSLNETDINICGSGSNITPNCLHLISSFICYISIYFKLL